MWEWGPSGKQPKPLGSERLERVLLVYWSTKRSDAGKRRVEQSSRVLLLLGSRDRATSDWTGDERRRREEKVSRKIIAKSHASSSSSSRVSHKHMLLFVLLLLLQAAGKDHVLSRIGLFEQEATHSSRLFILSTNHTLCYFDKYDQYGHRTSSTSKNKSLNY